MTTISNTKSNAAADGSPVPKQPAVCSASQLHKSSLYKLPSINFENLQMQETTTRVNALDVRNISIINSQYYNH